MLKHVFDFRTLHSRVNRHCNCAGEETGKIRDRNLGTILHVYCDPVARFGPASDKPTRETLCLAIELRIGEYPVLDIESRLVWNAACSIAQQRCEGHEGHLLQITGGLECAAGPPEHCASCFPMHRAKRRVPIQPPTGFCQVQTLKVL